jgi:anti-anti-sigma factor
MAINLVIEDLADGVTKAALQGRLDIDGAQMVDMRFNVLAGAKKKLVIDLGDVDFLASMGLRTLLTCARTVKSKGGMVAIANPQPGVAKVLSTSGVDEIMTVSPTLAGAIAAVTA